MNTQLLRYAYPIAGGLVLLGLLFFVLARPKTVESIENTAFLPESQKADEIRAALADVGFADANKPRNESLNAGLELYRQGRYAEAERAFDRHLLQYTNDQVATFYLGMSLLYQQKFSQALQLLSELALLDGFELQDEARWYATLCGCGPDREQSIRQFEQIAANPASAYQQAAKVVLNTVRLHPGPFSFQIQGDAGRPDAAPSYALVIEAPRTWWQTPWLRNLILALLAGATIGLVWWRREAARREQERVERQVAQRTASLLQQKQEMELEKARSEELLLNILPAETAEELKMYGKSNARRFEMVTVLFSDFQGFTQISEQMPPEELVADLDYCFKAFDEIMQKHGLEKIKTVGDCYVCAGGLNNPGEDTAVTVVHAAQDMIAALQEFNKRQRADSKPAFEARIGIHTGPVVAGIVGIKKYAYDIWGDTVNIAARMEQSSEGGRINISEATYELVKEHFPCTYRGKVDAKGKGLVDMYFVE